MAIVVDASVARACGIKERSSAALSIACADTLVAIKNADLLVAMSPPLDAEWLKHAGTFARKWLVQMFSRKRVRRIQDVPALVNLRRIVTTLDDQHITDAVTKDLHLVELALVTDRRVISLDERIRFHLGDLSPRVTDLRRLHWTNPREERCLSWLRKGAPDDPTLLLVPSP